LDIGYLLKNIDLTGPNRLPYVDLRQLHCGTLILGGGMRRRQFITALGGAAAWPIWPVAARGQPLRKIPRVALVVVGTSESNDLIVKTLADGLSKLGYEGGRNIVLRNFLLAPQADQVEALLVQLVPDIDLLVIQGTVGAVATKKVVTTLPTVFLAVGDPVRTGVVASLANPGANITGITYEASTESWAKRIQILKEIIPDLNRVAVLLATGDPNSDYAMATLGPLAPTVGVTLVPVYSKSGDELEAAFDEIKRSQVGGMLVIASSLTLGNGKRIADLAFAYHMPSCHGFKETVALGGLVSFGPDFRAIVQQGSRIVVKIIKGEKPADIPVEQPTRYEVRVNLKTAKALGISIPPTLLALADGVIE
jgi:putative tryptophan/tyrosine transport system substrate-binding protein